MFELLLSNPEFMLLSVVLALIVAIVMIVGVVLFEQQRGRLDPATRWHDIRERLAVAREELARKEAAIAELAKKIEERDRLVAELAAMEERLTTLRLEMSGLADGRRQIEETKQGAANAATALAFQQDKLAGAQKELESAAKDLEICKAELARVNEEIERRKRQVEQTPEELKLRIEELNSSIAELKTSKVALEEDLRGLRNERGQLYAERAEHAELLARKSTLTGSIGQLIEDARKAQVEKDAASAEMAEKGVELIDLKREWHGANLALQSAREEAQALVARKEALEREVDKINGPNVGKADQLEEMIGDLKRLPTLLETPLSAKRVLQNEADALDNVYRYLKDLRLSYDRRTVAAFHTALKINDNSQLTVLAGVSGTGKSLLPRRYAEAMGIRFLPIAVEPRWDSPQDLLGFYNYIEKRYRATDLARSLVHMDPYNTSALADGRFGDQMMLVLLDEINLARVEYYFSEFLSRLETRPPYSAADEERNRRDSWISIDIRGVENGSIRLFPPHNMLFVGTMNDDESTQSLSDKVLDRSNILQFTAPQEFKKQQQVTDAPISEGYRSFAQWRGWIKTADHLRDAADDKARGVIRELADIMERSGRPFGHRLNASILTYAANYPKRTNLDEGLEMAMVDQIEFRILPKLRGLRIEDYGAEFERLEKLVSEELQDPDFGDRLRSVVEQQRNAGGLFNWRGFARNT